ncbi:MAG: EamA family transporter [Myxococcota bacterium]
MSEGLVTAYALAFGSSLAWAGLDAARKGLAGVFPSDWTGPVALVVWLTLGQSPLFAAWWLVDGGALPAGDYWLPGLVGLALQVVANLLFVRAVQVSPLSLTVPFLSLAPAFAVVAAAVLLRETPTARQLAGTALVVAGALGLHARGLWHGLREEPGSAMMVAVAALWAVTSNFDRYVTDLAAPGFHALVQNGGVGVLLLGLFAARREGGAALGAARRRPGLLLGAFLLAGLAFASQLLAVKTLIVPVVETMKRGLGVASAVVLGRLVFREALAVRKLLAVGAMMAGTALML